MKPFDFNAKPTFECSAADFNHDDCTCCGAPPDWFTKGADNAGPWCAKCNASHIWSLCLRDRMPDAIRTD